MLPSAHPSPQPKRHLDRFSHSHSSRQHRPACPDMYVPSAKNCSLDLDRIYYMVPGVYPTQHPKRHLDRLSRFCTAHDRQFLYFTIGVLVSQKLPFPMGDLDLHVIHYCLSPSKPEIQTASRSLEPFLYSTPQSDPTLYNGPPLRLHNCRFPWVDLDPI